MKIMKTKFYPVNIESKVIVDEPFDKERDLAWKYRGQPVIGMPGKRILEYRCYQEYTLKPRFALPDLLEEWAWQEKRSQFLWKGAAAFIGEMFGKLAGQEMGHEQLLDRLKKSCPTTMAVSVYYERAQDEVKYLMQWRQHPQGAPLGQLVV